MKLVALLLVAAMAGLAGCGGADSPEVAAPPDAPDTPAAPADDAAGAADAAATQATAETGASSVLAGLTMAGLDGQPIQLGDYQGQVVLFVNVASRCGNTPQYTGLQRLHERYADQGLVVVGVPSNDFGGQEPGTAEQIAEFCQTNYGVQFTLLDKVSVKGDQQCELYRRLTDPANDPTAGDEVQWNFEKFLIGRDGRIAARFRPKVQPESEEVLAAIESALTATP